MNIEQLKTEIINSIILLVNQKKNEPQMVFYEKFYLPENLIHIVTSQVIFNGNNAIDLDIISFNVPDDLKQRWNELNTYPKLDYKNTLEYMIIRKYALSNIVALIKTQLLSDYQNGEFIV